MSTFSKKQYSQDSFSCQEKTHLVAAIRLTRKGLKSEETGNHVRISGIPLKKNVPCPTPVFTMAGALFSLEKGSRKSHWLGNISHTGNTIGTP